MSRGAQSQYFTHIFRYHQCLDGKCINRRIVISHKGHLNYYAQELICNGEIHLSICEDYSDELFCTCETRIGMKTCPGGSNMTDCIPRDWVCDGFPDCPGGSEETKCMKALNTAGNV